MSTVTVLKYLFGHVILFLYFCMRDTERTILQKTSTVSGLIRRMIVEINSDHCG